MCQNCKSAFDITLTLLSLSERLIHFENKCPKCARDLRAVCEYSFLTIENNEFAGKLALAGMQFQSVKQFNFSFTCGSCDESYITQGIDKEKELIHDSV